MAMGKVGGFLHEFREFAIKGNMLDMAVGVIIGGAFSKIVDSLVKDVIMPFVNWVIGSEVDFSNMFIILSKPANYSGPETYQALKAAGANLLAYGEFVTIFINFLILAFVVFLIVKVLTKTRAAFEHKKKEEAAAADAADIALLKEIRDLLAKQTNGTAAGVTAHNPGGQDALPKS